MSVRCRAGSREAPDRIRSRWPDSRSLSSANPIAPLRPAASSMASGLVEFDHQLGHVVDGRGVPHQSGVGREGPFDEEGDGRGPGRGIGDGRRRRSVAWATAGAAAEGALGGAAEALPAGGQHRDVRAVRQQRLDQLGYCPQDVFRVRPAPAGRGFRAAPPAGRPADRRPGCGRRPGRPPRVSPRPRTATRRGRPTTPLDWSAASCAATAVLPTPPGPTTVTQQPGLSCMPRGPAGARPAVQPRSRARRAPGERLPLRKLHCARGVDRVGFAPEDPAIAAPGSPGDGVEAPSSASRRRCSWKAASASATSPAAARARISSATAAWPCGASAARSRACATASAAAVAEQQLGLRPAGPVVQGEQPANFAGRRAGGVAAPRDAAPALQDAVQGGQVGRLDRPGEGVRELLGVDADLLAGARSRADAERSAGRRPPARVAAAGRWCAGWRADRRGCRRPRPGRRSAPPRTPSGREPAAAPPAARRGAPAGNPATTPSTTTAGSPRTATRSIGGPVSPIRSPCRSAARPSSPAGPATAS